MVPCGLGRTLRFAFSALILLVGQQVELLACKKLRDEVLPWLSHSELFHCQQCTYWTWYWVNWLLSGNAASSSFNTTYVHHSRHSTTTHNSQSTTCNLTFVPEVKPGHLANNFGRVRPGKYVKCIVWPNFWVLIKAHGKLFNSVRAMMTPRSVEFHSYELCHATPTSDILHMQPHVNHLACAMQPLHCRQVRLITHIFCGAMVALCMRVVVYLRSDMFRVL